MSTGKLLTVAAVAEHFDVGVHIVLGWIARGELRAINVASSVSAKRPTWRIPADALVEFEAAREPKPARRRPTVSTHTSTTAYAGTRRLTQVWVDFSAIRSRKYHGQPCIRQFGA